MPVGVLNSRPSVDNFLASRFADIKRSRVNSNSLKNVKQEKSRTADCTLMADSSLRTSITCTLNVQIMGIKLPADRGGELNLQLSPELSLVWVLFVQKQ